MGYFWTDILQLEHLQYRSSIFWCSFSKLFKYFQQFLKLDFFLKNVVTIRKKENIMNIWSLRGKFCMNNLGNLLTQQKVHQEQNGSLWWAPLRDSTLVRWELSLKIKTTNSFDDVLSNFHVSLFNLVLLMLQKKKGTFHHSSFLAGGVTLAAGRLVVIDGTLQVQYFSYFNLKFYVGVW